MPERGGPHPRDISFRSRRNNVLPRVMREFSRGPSEDWLVKRAEWLVTSAKVQEYLKPKIVFKDRLAGDVERGVTVLAVGAGKGHELDEMDSLLPGSTMIGVDPHDFSTRPVDKRLKTLAHDAQYLGIDVSAEHLRGIPDRSVDAVTFFFVLHHVDPHLHEAAFREIDRVLKDDGYVFVAEDLVDNEKERAVTQSIDNALNWGELGVDQKHTYRNTKEWEDFFNAHGFGVIDEHEEKPGKVRHGFFVLQRQREVEGYPHSSTR